MGFVIGLIIGVALGAAIAYFLASKKSSTQAATLQDLKRQLDLAESEHERRLREATSRLQQDYEAQLQAAQAQAAKAQTQAAPVQPMQPARPTTPPPNSRVSPPTTNREATAPLPKPTTIPSEPDVAAPPVTATAPAPTPQPVIQSPDLPKQSSEKQVPGSTPTSSVADPNVLLADSYSPDAETRRNVALAIAAILPTAGAKGQARWFPVLGRLARDGDSSVRLKAVQALAGVKSSKRLPLLQRALRDTDPAVVEAANQMLSQTKGRSLAHPKPPKRRLPKNR